MIMTGSIGFKLCGQIGNWHIQSQEEPRRFKVATEILQHMRNNDLINIRDHIASQAKEIMDLSFTTNTIHQTLFIRKRLCLRT